MAIGDKKHLNLGKYPPEGTDSSRSEYYSSFIAEWKKLEAPAEAPVKSEPAPAPALVIAPPKAELAPASVKRRFWAFLVLLFSAAAIAVSALSHFKVLPEYSAFSYLSIFEIFEQLVKSAPAGTIAKIAHYALPAAFGVSVIFLVISLFVSVASLASKKKVCQIWPVAVSFVFAITVFAWLFILGGGRNIGFLKFASPFGGKVLWGYYAFAALQLLALLSSFFVNKKDKKA